MKKTAPTILLLVVIPGLLACLRVMGADLPEIWNLPGGFYVESCPAIDPAGNIYVTTSGSTRFYAVNGGELVAMDPHGAEKWVFKTFCDNKSSPAIGADGTIYFGCRDRRLYAITPKGRERWSFLTGAWVDSSPAIGTNGTIYFGSWDGKFYALNPDGTKKWEFATGGPVDSSPAIGVNGTIYFGSHDSNFYAINPDGAKKWSLTTDGAVISSPAIAGDGTIVFSSMDGRLYAVHPDGTLKWRLWTGGVGESSPVIDQDGNIYTGLNSTIVAVSADGTNKWEAGFPTIEGAAAVTADGTVYVGGTDTGGGKLFAWTSDGTRTSGAILGGVVTGSPAISPNGAIYLGSAGFVCRSFKGGSVLAHAGWPKFRGNAAQNGRAGAN